jgi:transposase
MPKKIDPAIRGAVRLVREHRSEYPSLTAAAAAVARQERLGKETVRHWAVQAEIDSGERVGMPSEELIDVRALKARVRRLEEDNAILKLPRFSSLQCQSRTSPAGFARCFAAVAE